MLKKKFGPALNGVLTGLRHPAIRTQFVLGLLAVLAGILFRLTSGEWIAVILCIGMVISSEILNTCIECLCDFMTTERNEEIRIIKDLAAGAVLIAAAASFVVALIVFGRHIF